MLGLDPDPGELLPEAVDAGTASHASEGSDPAEAAARAVVVHCRALIAAAGAACVAVKPQLACFERLGAPGRRALGDVCAAARDAGLLVLADGKRGDVPHTASAYAQSLLGATSTPWGDVEGLGADAVTLNPLLGRDSVEPFISAARARECGCFLLVRTSNPGAAELQDRSEAANCPPLHEQLAALVEELGATSLGSAACRTSERSWPRPSPRCWHGCREPMPHAIFLLPGIGAQGGTVEAMGAAFAPGRAAALVTASRSIAGPALAAGSAEAAYEAAERLRESAWALAGGSA